MYDFSVDIEAQAKKLDLKIRKLQEEKARFDEKLQSEKQRLDLARKVGLLVVGEFKGKKFEYGEFKTLLATHLVDDFERKFFDLAVLAADDPRRPKKRGRKKVVHSNE
jgi:hypothetical protein